MASLQAAPTIDPRETADQELRERTALTASWRLPGLIRRHGRRPWDQDRPVVGQRRDGAPRDQTRRLRTAHDLIRQRIRSGGSGKRSGVCRTSLRPVGARRDRGGTHLRGDGRHPFACGTLTRISRAGIVGDPGGRPGPLVDEAGAGVSGGRPCSTRTRSVRCRPGRHGDDVRQSILDRDLRPLSNDPERSSYEPGSSGRARCPLGLGRLRGFLTSEDRV